MSKQSNQKYRKEKERQLKIKTDNSTAVKTGSSDRNTGYEETRNRLS